MNDKESHPIRNGVIATVIGGIILSFWSPFRELFVAGYTWASEILNSIWNWLFSTHDIYGWLIILVLALSIPTAIKLAALLLKKKEPGVEDLYTSDYLFGANWHWSYVNGSINNLWCLCPTCKGELVYSEFRPNRYDFTHDRLEAKTDFSCEKCGAVRCTLKGTKDYALGTVEREIRRKIRNNEWQTTAGS